MNTLALGVFFLLFPWSVSFSLSGLFLGFVLFLFLWLQLTSATGHSARCLNRLVQPSYRIAEDSNIRDPYCCLFFLGVISLSYFWLLFGSGRRIPQRNCNGQQHNMYTSKRSLAYADLICTIPYIQNIHNHLNRCSIVVVPRNADREPEFTLGCIGGACASSDASHATLSAWLVFQPALSLAMSQKCGVLAPGNNKTYAWPMHDNMYSL